MTAWPDYLGADPDESPDPDDELDLDEERDDGDFACDGCGFATCECEAP